ncbi:E3 ubiquitin-protein ligase LRSAM1-like isoform X2 [Venturia canescens]|uniref:E3 ubiquitin-protein ligase LRSAM1-like isoform X2 n=1 Tax=Venturia canescens TaxID=32260 RepID=UPI001C9CCEF8|nr:E3 ubiquitin-protein ligase LRSAM1-like isoform X2 [Venturia canescens]
MTRATRRCCHDGTSIMSFTKKHRGKVNVDYKARLEHKLYLARENPEPVFDISDCSLKQVPSGIYSLCKVFRKRVLLMQCNRLTTLLGGGALSDLSLLTVLDLRNNEFTNLPTEIVHLVSLKELYIQDNNIRKLPAELGDLENLTILNVAKNKLKGLPDSMGMLKKLSILDISRNEAVQKLPMTLGQAQSLKEINLEGLDNLSYPPKDILLGGTIVIVAFLAHECGIEYAPEKYKKEEESVLNVDEQEDQARRLNKDSIVQEMRQNALLEVEKNIKEQQEYELELQSVLKGHRKKLLDDLVQQQTQLEQEIEKVQQERDLNRARLLSFIYNAEKEADHVITEFLRSSEEERQTQAELLEQEKLEEMRILSQCHTEQFNLRTKETLLAMEELLGEELLTERKIDEYTKFRDCNAQSLLELEVRNNHHLAEVVRDQKRSQEDLVNRLRKDEVLQRAAVAALLERSDARSWSIVQQVTLVQSQLAALTSIELERKKFEINQQINDLADKRVTLSAILVDLLDQQEKRRKQLLETIQQIEEQRNVDSTRRNSLFWLMQYQSLMEARPKGLLEGLEPTLVRHVAIAGALHCLPFLVTLPSLMQDLDDERLQSIGIHCEKDRAAIKLAVENYLAEKKLGESPIDPSAPIDLLGSPVYPSAPSDEPCTSSKTHEPTTIPSISTTECVVCLDSHCEVIFLPCGHLCCCAACSSKVTTECPMCRGLIQRKVQAI